MSANQDDDSSFQSSPSSLNNQSVGLGNDNSTRYALQTGPLPPNAKWDQRLQEIYDVAWPAVTKLEEDGWQFNQEADGVQVYLKKPPADASGSGSLQYCKGIGSIPADIETVRCIFACSETKNEWDSMYNTGTVVELIDTNTVVAYANFKGVMFVKGRDFCTIGRSIVLEGGGVFVYYGSVQHPECAITSKYVRGELLFSALYLTPNKDDHNITDVVYALAQDPKGSIPKSLVDAANLLQPRTIATVRDLIAQKPTVVQQAVRFETKKFQDAVAIIDGKALSTTGSTDGDTTLSAAGGEFVLAEDGDFDQKDYHFDVLLPDINAIPEEDRKLLNDAFKKAWNATKEDESHGWAYHKEIQGVKIWLKDSGEGPVKLSKGTGSIDAPPAHVHSMFVDSGTRKSWDEMFGSSAVLDQLDHNTYIGCATFLAPWPLSARQFCSITRTALLKDGSIFHWSINYNSPKFPEDPKYVRGTLLFSGLHIIPTEGGKKSQIVYAIGSNPGGSIPASMAELAALSQPLCIAAIQKVVSTQPNTLEQAVQSCKARYEKISGSGSGFNISRETLPSIGSIDWPVFDDVSTDENKWLTPLHDFYKKSSLSRLTSSFSYAWANGGLFRALSTDFLTPTATTTDDPSKKLSTPPTPLQNLPFGHLALKITHLRGKYMTVLNNMQLYFTLSFENHQIRTPSAPNFDPHQDKGKKEDKFSTAAKKPISGSNAQTNTFSSPITRTDSIVLIELWGEQRQAATSSSSSSSGSPTGVSRACLGSLRLTIGELFDGDLPHTANLSNNSKGSGKPTQARRCWFPLTNVPIEIERTCTHAELVQLKTKTGKQVLSDFESGAITHENAGGAQYLNDPRGLFVCFESCVLISSVQLYFNDLLSIEQSHYQYSNPHSTLAAMDLCLPPTLCKHPKLLLENAHIPKDPELCRRIGSMALTLTGGNLISSTSITGEVEPDDMPGSTAVFSSHLFVRNVTRCLYAVAPLFSLCNIFYDLITWTSTIHSLFACCLWIFLCFHPYLFLPCFTILVLYTFLINAAEQHFLQASSRSNTTFAQAIKQRYLLTQQYSEQLHNLIPNLSPRTQALGVLLQVITGRIATLLEKIQSLFNWSRINDNTLTMLLITLVSCAVSVVSLYTHNLLTSRLGVPIGSQNPPSLLDDSATTFTSVQTSLIRHQHPVVQFILEHFLFMSNTNLSTTSLIPPITILVPTILLLAQNSSILLRVKLLTGSLFRAHSRLLHIRRESRTIRLFTSEPKQ